MHNGTSKKEATIEGLIVVAEWKENGDTSRIAILTKDREEYLVADNWVGRALLDYESAMVKATGVLDVGESGKRILILSSFEQV